MNSIIQRNNGKNKESQAILNKKNGVGSLIILYLKLNYQAIVIKRTQYWHKSDIDKWNTVVDSNISLCYKSYLIFVKVVKMHTIERLIFNNWWYTWILTCRKIKQDSGL